MEVVKTPPQSPVFAAKRRRRNSQSVTPSERNGNETAQPQSLTKSDSLDSLGVEFWQRVPIPELSCDDDDIATSMVSHSKPTSPPVNLQSIKTTVEQSGAPSSLHSRSSASQLLVSVIDTYKRMKAIPSLYEWQWDCISSFVNSASRRLLYCLPTGAGKTLVAELAALMTVQEKKNVLIVQPYVSVVEEKIRSLAPLMEHFGFKLETFAGIQGKLPLPRNRPMPTIYIATIEKGNGIVNHLIETARVYRFGLVIVDEFHMIGVPKRGATLEMLLSKLIEYSSVGIMGMSATVGNIDQLASFLHADVYKGEYRAVALNEYILMGKQLYKVNSLRKIEKDRTIRASNDNEALLELVQEVLPNQTLVFCRSRDTSQTIAMYIARCLRGQQSNDKIQNLRERLISNLKEIATVCPILKQTIPFGVVYHHAGLLAEERKALEAAYHAKAIHCICCTPTLAAGVNLPAQRVIIRHPHVGRSLLKTNVYHQMCGRAGRAGYTQHPGEAIMFCPIADYEEVKKEIIEAPICDCMSQLDSNDGYEVCRNILALVVAEKVSSIVDIVKWFSFTLYFTQKKVDCKLFVENKANFLLEENFIKLDAGKLSVTSLGAAVHESGVELRYAKYFYSEIQTHIQNMNLCSDLHLLLLVVPLDSTIGFKTNFEDLRKRFLPKLNENDRKVAEKAGCGEAYITKMISNFKTNKHQTEPWKNAEFKGARFQLALILSESVSGNNMYWEVAEKYNISRSFVQDLLQQAALSSFQLASFCNALQLWQLARILEALPNRLAYGVPAELVPFVQLEHVTRQTARGLFRAGYRSLQDIASSNVRELMAKLPGLQMDTAKKIFKNARDTLRVLVEDTLAEISSQTT
eukprot:m.77990 g.77990  ORF g.77990 m.77990 type:complete len:861 (+) comp12651_c0_seq2:204-2786(+)